MKRLVHHFTIAEIGSLVTFRPHPDSLIYELCLPGKVGIIRAIENRMFGQELTVDFNFILRFAEQNLKRMTLSPWVFIPKGYETRWRKGCVPKYEAWRVVSVGDTLTEEQIQHYNSAWHRYERLVPGNKYVVTEAKVNGPLPDCEGYISVEYDNPSNNIGPTWRVSGDNLAPLAQWIIDGDGKGNSLIAHSIKRTTPLSAPSSPRGGPPSAGIDPDATKQPHVGEGSTPSAYYFATPPSVELCSPTTPTRNVCMDGKA